MKLECHIIEARDHGDRLFLRLQGWGVADPHGQFCSAQELLIPITAKNKRAFHIGRRVTIEVKPEKA